MFLRKIKLERILSFKDTELELRPLNVLIGANASGKSNLLRVMGLVKALPRDMQTEIANGGGPREWINRRTGGPAQIELSLETTIRRYSLTFQASGQSYEILEESAPLIFHRELAKIEFEGTNEVALVPSAQESALAQWRIPGQFIGRLGSVLESIRLYREFKAGPGTPTRMGIVSSGFSAYLSEDGSNLALVLNELNLHTGLNRANELLHQFFDPFEQVIPNTRGGITQLYIRERGVSTPFSAVSLSDGTLRLLCLLAILLDPEPPPLVCIEEPEAGLHPDAIRMVAELLVEASSRTQLIVTTHSPALVDELSDQPESVVVCERDFDGFTQFRRLKSEDLDEWLERYKLGQLWQKGEIGGNRW